MPENTSPPPAAPNHPRLPCRGCTGDCAHYDICGGTPWRIDQKQLKPEAIPG
ncbi:MAG: hypothetical protein RJQ10_01660 [Haliea sp.]|uniref:hypothetical protein n=1 Tax=Haliea sp. TaxID=1932666 RepID=UPI0032EB2D25